MPTIGRYPARQISSSLTGGGGSVGTPAAWRARACTTRGYRTVNWMATISAAIWMIQPVQTLSESSRTASPMNPETAATRNAAAQAPVMM